MTAYFVTATGTDIGKTFVTAGLIRHLRDAGKRVDALKPVVSGFDLATAAISDPGVLLEALGVPITPESLDRISPWRFAAPLSPDMAAARESRSVPYDEVVSLCRDAVARHAGTLFIEGVGGVMVPLDEHLTVLDWMVALDLPAIVITGTYLGTISHTLTALDVLKRANVTVAALVLNDTGDGGVPLAETRATLACFAPHVVIAEIPRVKSFVAARTEFARLAALL
jgi:dethiobiotin synthetase